MKKQSAPQEAKYFKYKFTPPLILLSVAVILLCIAAIIVSVYQISRFGIQQPLDVFKYPFLIGVSVFCIVIVVSLSIKSQYIVDNTHITTQFGFIKSKTDIQTITSATLNMDTHKLTLNFGEEFSVLTLSDEWSNDFVQALLSVNKKINYNFTFTDADKK